MKCFLLLCVLVCCGAEYKYKKVPLAPYCTPSRTYVLATTRTGQVYLRAVDLSKVYILVPVKTNTMKTAGESRSTMKAHKK